MCYIKYNIEWERVWILMPGTLLYGLILFDIIEGKKYIGGPAINIALHMAYHGNQPTLVSCVGNDSLGDRIKELLVNNSVSTDFIKTDDQHDTGTVPVFLDKNGNPTFDIMQPVAYDFITLTEKQLEELSTTKFDIVYFGTVVQRTHTSAETLQEILKCVSYNSCFFDINLRKGHFTKAVIDFSLRHTDILKLNEDELLEVATMFGLGMSEEQTIIEWVFGKYPAKIILLTRGDKGASVFTPDKRKDIDGIKVKVKDTVGSGDAFSAGFIMEYIKSGDLMRAAEKGNELGAYVAARSGAVPEINEQ
jgi:fructokinase